MYTGVMCGEELEESERCSKTLLLGIHSTEFQKQQANEDKALCTYGSSTYPSWSNGLPKETTAGFEGVTPNLYLYNCPGFS